LTFWAELRRRSVVRVAGVYAVVGWLLAQAAALAESAMGLPAWFDGAVLTLLLLGFPVALVLAWAFELTPQGVKLTPPADGSEPARPPVLIDFALLAALLLVAGGVLYTAARPAARPAEVAEAAAAPPPAVADDRPSIAVLPFANMSSDPEQEYFSDGLSEELLNELAQIAGLRVIARTSSFAFKGESQDLRAVGQALGVGHLLEGSVRKSGDRLRIVAQLIDASDGSHLWSESYDRDLTDVFAIQEEIAAAVADALSVTLGVGAARDRARGTDSAEAYDLYLRGVSWYNQGGRTGFGRAAELYEQATALDRDFAEAWTALAAANLRRLLFIDDGVEEMRADIAAALDRATALSPDLPGAYEQRAELLAGARDWPGAAQALARAHALSPPDVRDCVDADFAILLGRRSDALVACRLASRDRDPLSLDMSTALQRALDLTGRYDEAEIEYRRSLDLVGARAPVEHIALIRAWIVGDPARIEAQLRRFIDATATPRAPLEVVLAAGEDAPAALAILRTAMVDPANQDPLTQFAYASFLVRYGDPAGAAAGLRRAFSRPGGVPYEFLWAPIHAEARREPAFKDTVRDLGMVDYWRATGEWSDFCRPLGPDDFECF
jgi:TolB-like protein